LKELLPYLFPLGGSLLLIIYWPQMVFDYPI